MEIQTVELGKRRCAKAQVSGKVQLWVSLPLLDIGGLTMIALSPHASTHAGSPPPGKGWYSKRLAVYATVLGD